MSTNDLQAKAKELKELQRMAEEIKQEIENIQDVIKAEMAARDTDEIVTGEYKIRWKEVISNRFDTKAFQSKYETLYSQFCKQSCSRRFSIV